MALAAALTAPVLIITSFSFRQLKGGAIREVTQAVSQSQQRQVKPWFRVKIKLF